MPSVPQCLSMDREDFISSPESEKKLTKIRMSGQPPTDQGSSLGFCVEVIVKVTNQDNRQ